MENFLTQSDTNKQLGTFIKQRLFVSKLNLQVQMLNDLRILMKKLQQNDCHYFNNQCTCKQLAYVKCLTYSPLECENNNLCYWDEGSIIQVNVRDQLIIVNHKSIVIEN
ncbi:hypothetical protein pb186bvf_018525 [Paramecium bursaria]